MMMSSAARRAARPAAKSPSRAKTKKLQLEDFVNARDYTGAIALLEFQRQAGEEQENSLEWLGYCAFHLGDFQKALNSYDQLLREDDQANEEIHLYKACCYYYLQMYKEANEAAEKGPKTALKNRILLHVSHKTNDETSLVQRHQALGSSTEDQLTLAAIHFLRGHYQEATDIYKRMLLENRDDLALNVYIAMCYYKLDYYDVSLEILAVYLQAHPDSAVALNLKACNHFRLYNGKAAAAELKTLTDAGHTLQDNDLIKHNLVVFRNGANALQVLPPLVEFLPEARLNLVIHYLRSEEVQEAYDLIKDLEPSTPQEYILKAVVNANIGQASGSREHMKMAQQYFQLVGASATECDTIPGRQCMASCFFLLKQFEDVNTYLKSTQAYLSNDDNYNWNYGISLAATKQFKEAEERLLMVQNEGYLRDYCYLSWLSRCFIRNGTPQKAWELYLKMDTGNESFNLLQLISNDCYETGAFFYAAKAFDVLERIDPDPEYWEGKRGALVGTFQKVIAGEDSKDKMRDVIQMLRNTNNPQVDYILSTMMKWCKDNDVETS